MSSLLLPAREGSYSLSELRHTRHQTLLQRMGSLWVSPLMCLVVFCTSPGRCLYSKGLRRNTNKNAGVGGKKKYHRVSWINTLAWLIPYYNVFGQISVKICSGKAIIEQATVFTVLTVKCKKSSQGCCATILETVGVWARKWIVSRLDTTQLGLWVTRHQARVDFLWIGSARQYLGFQNEEACERAYKYWQIALHSTVYNYTPRPYAFTHVYVHT